ncbi:glycosyltransferase family 4 protein [Sphingorhabdus arenilitoris]|uniref:Glycosyltransferase family 4 protein n=1 Tax=Sphingorhabdus arenilitoris TaxID=1490041 RepID=A0ABV8RD58_9SPHN
MRIALATDAWAPQVNGVVRTLTETTNRLLARGHEVELITPNQFRTVACPGYREIRLAVAPRFGARKTLTAFRPDIVHIATEGPIGWSARRWCMKYDIPFTSAFHTRFPDYAAVRTGLSPDRFWPLMRRFHGPSRAVLAATPRLMAELSLRGIAQTRLWQRGIDSRIFQPGLPPHPAMAKLPRPILLSVGRVAVEKNLDAFLSSSVNGTKVVVGDGPALAMMKARYPDAIFLGKLSGDALASAYAAADIFVFPSLTDTFGLVMIEALACGVPVAGYRVAGPLDIVGENGRGADGKLPAMIGAVHDDLSQAIDRAIASDRQLCAEYGGQFDWDECTDQFAAALRDALGSGPINSASKAKKCRTYRMKASAANSGSVCKDAFIRDGSHFFVP